MINTLFSMHNIKYIISVDDCFFARKREDIEATVYSEMCNSLDPFKEILSSSEQAGTVNEICDMLNIGVDVSTLLETLVNDLPIEHLQKCYEICKENETTNTEERDRIISFLEALKSGGQIKEYRTFSSTIDANRFDVQAAGMTDGGILWLLDRNFSRVGESEDAGLSFAENILKTKDDSRNYIYILSAIEPAANLKEDDIEEEFDKILAAYCSPDTHSLIYYISKQRLSTQNNDKIAMSLAQGFKRKACFELFQLFTDCLSDGLSEASSRVQKIRQKTLNYLFSNKASARGEPYIEVAARLVQIFHQDEYNKAVAGRYMAIAEKARYYEHLCSAINETVGNERVLTATLKEYRDIELYNKHINEQHCEIATGDIFKIDSSYFLLVSQACDTCLRTDGRRKLEYASLLEIQDNKQVKFSYSLPCFLDMKNPAVMYHALKILPFEILDLCTYNASGQATVLLKDVADHEGELKLYTDNFRLRFYEVHRKLKEIHFNCTILKNFWEDTSVVSVESAHDANTALEGVDPNLKRFESIDMLMSFPVKRLCRLSELTTIDIIKEYGVMLSRIGQPFDFINDD